MIGLILMLGAGVLGTMFVTKKLTVAQIKAEVVKLEGEAKVEEQAIVAKVKALLAKL